ncbi:UBN2 domain-containing protein, partial [Tanacetum coccineum]
AQVSTAATTVTITTEEITLAQALEALKTSKPKVKGIVFQEPAKFDEEERLAREKSKKVEEANIALIETWDDIQAKIDVDHQLAERLQLKKQKRKETKAFKRVNTFEYFRIELVEGKEKIAGIELAQEITNKQKVEDDKEKTEIKKLMEIIPDEEEVAIDAIPLAIKSLNTPIVEKNKLDEDLQGTPVDATLYRSMIGSLMYLTSSRPNLIYESAYVPAYSDADHEGCQDTRRSTSGSAQFLGETC